MSAQPLPKVTERSKKEEAEYQLQKEARERVLKEQESALSERKQELEDLRLWKKNSETKLQSELERSGREVTAKLKAEHEMKTTITDEKYLAEKRVSELTIESLKSRLAQYEQDIGRLKKELETANAGVKDIALKVIEGGNRISEQHRSIKEEIAEKSREGRGAAA